MNCCCVAPWSASSSTEKSSSSVHDVLLTTMAGRSRRSAHVWPVSSQKKQQSNKRRPSALSSVNNVLPLSMFDAEKGAASSGASQLRRVSSACASTSLRRWNAAPGLSCSVLALQAT